MEIFTQSFRWFLQSTQNPVLLVATLFLVPQLDNLKLAAGVPVRCSCTSQLQCSNTTEMGQWANRATFSNASYDLQYQPWGVVWHSNAITFISQPPSNSSTQSIYSQFEETKPLISCMGQEAFQSLGMVLACMDLFQWKETDFSANLKIRGWRSKHHFTKMCTCTFYDP